MSTSQPVIGEKNEPLLGELSEREIVVFAAVHDPISARPVWAECCLNRVLSEQSAV